MQFSCSRSKGAAYYLQECLQGLVQHVRSCLSCCLRAVQRAAEKARPKVGFEGDSNCRAAFRASHGLLPVSTWHSEPCSSASGRWSRVPARSDATPSTSCIVSGSRPIWPAMYTIPPEATPCIPTINSEESLLHLRTAVAAIVRVDGSLKAGIRVCLAVWPNASGRPSGNALDVQDARRRHRWGGCCEKLHHSKHAAGQRQLHAGPRRRVHWRQHRCVAGVDGSKVLHVCQVQMHKHRVLPGEVSLLELCKQLHRHRDKITA